MKIKADFDPISELYLVYPEGVYEESKYNPIDYSDLSSFYDELIQFIPTNIKLKLYVKTRSIADKLKGIRENLQIMVNNGLTSIWIRDWSGFSTGNKLYKPIFKPNYYRGEYYLADKINQTAYSLHSFMGIDMEGLPLTIDGGNFVTNGEVAIITKRVFIDNPKKSEKEIVQILNDTLKIEPVFIDEIKDEDTSHADGCFAFLSKKDLAVSKYPDSWYKEDNEYIEAQIKKLDKHRFNIHRIIDYPTEKEGAGDGLFVNFLKLNDCILMPKYRHVSEKDIADNAKKLAPFGQVQSIDCTKLSAFGCVLHCISFTN
jgi:agmatine/peptidylarginine deiminase